MYETKITYQIEGGSPAVALLENVHGHPMEGEFELDDFGIWFTSNIRNSAYWDAQVSFNLNCTSPELGHLFLLYLNAFYPRPTRLSNELTRRQNLDELVIFAANFY